LGHHGLSQFTRGKGCYWWRETSIRLVRTPFLGQIRVPSHTVTLCFYLVSSLDVGTSLPRAVVLDQAITRRRGDVLEMKTRSPHSICVILRVSSASIIQVTGLHTGTDVVDPLYGVIFGNGWVKLKAKI